MNTGNPTALFRSRIVYAICVPLAIVMGYLLVNFTNTNDISSLWVIGAVMGVMIFPLLIRWHYPLLILSYGLPVSLFFIKGQPSLFLFMVAASLSISCLERILNRNQPFLPASAVRWPLLAFLVVIIITAELTGGFGLRSMGSDVYGGKKYVTLIAGILSFFAITARPIPRRQANLYIGLYFIGAIFNIGGDFYSYVPHPLQFIYLILPASNSGVDAMGSSQVVLGVTRIFGIPLAAAALFSWMLARHGLRNTIHTGKLWRPLALGFLFILVFLGGYRSAIIPLILLVGLIFYLEKMHHTGVMLIVVIGGIMGGTLLIPLAPNLPYTFQRSLAFLPLNISPEVRMDAEGSTQWRLDMWNALLPQIPKYLLLGKGYAFSSQVFDESMGANATFHKTIDAADDPLALSSDFHNGPLSVIIPFGIWGAIVWLWFWVAGFWVVWRNYRYGDPALYHINMYLLAFFWVRCFMFLVIFGAMTEDVSIFGSIFGLSIALNHGVMGPRPVSTRNSNPAVPGLRPPFQGQPAFQR